jgi:ribonuclease R
MGRHLSERERVASDAERELTEWKKVRYMSDKVGEVYPGYVTGVQSFGLFVELDGVYVQGLVHVSSLGDDYYAFDERAHALKGENTGRTYRLGDSVRVRVAKVDLEQRKVDFALADLPERAAGARPPGPSARPGARRSRGAAPRPPVRKTARRAKGRRA